MSPNSTVLTAPTSPAELPASVSLDSVVSRLTDDNIVTLKQTIAVIKAARADTKNADPKIAGRAKLKLGTALYYLSGFMDGIGAFQPRLNTGFETGFESKLPQEDPETQLDTLIKQLDEALSHPDTRFIPLIIAGVIAGVFVAGAVCKLAAACMD